MTSVHGFARWVVATAMMAAVTGVASSQPINTGPDVPQLTQSIVQAQDPSTAIQAYARAQAQAPADMEIEHAYLHKMIEFGMPEMAASQASDLTLRNPKDGEAWAVVAYMTAKRAQGGPATAAALVNIQTAVTLGADNPFVIRTAAQLVAWYDVRADKSQVDAAARTAVNDLQSHLANNASYADAYSRARSDYQRMIAEAGPGAAEPATPNTGLAQQPAPDYGAAVVTVPQYVPYPEPYYAAAPYDPWWYPGGYYDSWWWPSFGGFFFFDDDDFHHHHHDFDRDGRRDFDGGRSFVRSGDRTGGRDLTRPAIRSNVNRSTTTWNDPRGGSPRTTTVAPSVRSSDPARINTSARSLSGSSRLTVPTRVNTLNEAPRLSSPAGAPRLSGPSLGGGGMESHSFGGGGEFHGGVSGGGGGIHSSGGFSGGGHGGGGGGRR